MQLWWPYLDLARALAALLVAMGLASICIRRFSNTPSSFACVVSILFRNRIRPPIRDGILCFERFSRWRHGGFALRGYTVVVE
jgi:hypothetical protein